MSGFIILLVGFLVALAILGHWIPLAIVAGIAVLWIIGSTILDYI